VSTAGYSGTPQALKLGLAAGVRVDTSSAPAGWALQDPPAGLVPVGPPEPADVVLAFVTDPDGLAERLAEIGERIRPDGAIWVLWPRKAAGHVSAMTENQVREAALPQGLVDVKVAAVDHDWSGLKVVWRRSER
jgi:hypothetical protein